jgi:hypothetical protein
MLYARLRRGARPAYIANSPLHSVEGDHTSQVLSKTFGARENLRYVDVDITRTLFEERLASVPNWARNLWVVPLFGLGSLILLKTHFGVMSVCMVVAYLFMNAGTQIRLYSTLHAWKKQRDSVFTMLNSLKTFGDVGQSIPHPILSDSTACLPEINRLLAALRPTLVERIPMIAEYANLFVLQEYVTFARGVDRFKEELPALRKIYESLSACEANLCLVEHLVTRETYCWVKESAPHSLVAEQMTNPLLASGKPLNVELRDTGAFITGKNGVGKSTFLRGLGLNILAGRAFGFCYCKSAELPLIPVWSSIQNEDSLETADSLYMAEMRRGETLLAVADGPKKVVFILDEIFRGTNNIESISVTAAVVSNLADRALVVMSSHNLVLAPLLASRLEPLRLVRGGLHSDELKLEPGVIAETNGIQMMDDYAIAEEVRSNARVVHDWFSGYVTKPSHFPRLS